MPNWNRIVREHLAVLRLPRDREIEIVEELALHLEAAYEDALADGLSEAEAEARGESETTRTCSRNRRARDKMDTEKIRKLTPYQDINSLLADWTEKAKNILGENVVGLYLSGSLSYGDFVPERSDIDLQAVVRRPLNESELKSIEQLHRGLDERYPAW